MTTNAVSPSDVTSVTSLMPKRLPANDDVYAEIVAWLIDEAALLDQRQFDEWYSRLATDVVYRMPVRSTLRRGDVPEPDRVYYHLDENHSSLWVRVRQFTDATTYVEDPPSRTRRFVTNIVIEQMSDDKYCVTSHLLILRSKGDSAHFEIFSCGRRDVVRRALEGGLLLAAREIEIDQTSLGTSSVGVLL